MARKPQIIGAAELARALRLLPKEMQAKVVPVAARAGANLLRREIRKRIPVRAEPGAKHISRGGSGGTREPGFAKRSIRVQRIKQAPRNVIRFAIGPSRKAFYLKFLEFGTSRQRARPMIRPAIAAAGLEVNNEAAKGLARGITNQAKRLNQRFGGKARAAARR